jgi:uncharacterized protein (DUF736 family)
MAFEQKDMSGALFRNDKKQKDTHPDYRGDAVINGVKVKIAAWLKQDKNGSKFFSLKFEEDTGERARPPTVPISRDLDDEVPF